MTDAVLMSHTGRSQLHPRPSVLHDRPFRALRQRTFRGPSPGHVPPESTPSPRRASGAERSVQFGGGGLRFEDPSSLTHTLASKSRNSSAFSSGERSPASQLAGTGALLGAAPAPTCTSVTTARPQRSAELGTLPP